MGDVLILFFVNEFCGSCSKKDGNWVGRFGWWGGSGFKRNFRSRLVSICMVLFIVRGGRGRCFLGFARKVNFCVFEVCFFGRDLFVVVRSGFSICLAYL